MEEEAPGLIAWLTVRNHRFSTGLYWRRGVFLDHQDHQALLELKSAREVLLCVRGRSPYYLFGLLKDSVERIIELRWPSLRYDFEIPCPHREADGRGCAGRFRFESVKKALERNLRSLQCGECLENQDVSLLLVGFAIQGEPLQHTLDKLITMVGEIKQDEGRMSEYVRRVLKAVTTETQECPRLFTLSPVEGTRWDPRQLGQVQYELQLWCEYSGHEHPVEKGKYMITKSKEWLVRLAPFASLVAKTLKIAVPLLGPSLDVAIGEELVKGVKPQLEMMEKITSSLLEGELKLDVQRGDFGGGLTQAQGSGLREFRSLLGEIDRTQTWGGLRRVFTPAGDYLWVCGEHYREFDPGLPVLPAVQRIEDQPSH